LPKLDHRKLQDNLEFMIPMPKRILNIIVFLFLASLSIYPISSAYAQTVTADDVIAAVNNLRAGGSLSPYQVDSWLMSYAQEHSEYQAKNNTSTHRHSDGLLPQQIGLQENVAAGDKGFITVNTIVNLIWADPIHMKTMVGYTNGFLGVGVASNDTTTFITLDVRPGSSAATVSPAAPITAVALALLTNTPAPFVPIITNTPLPDGSIVHIVTSGETLWEIALSYGLKVNDILALNGLSSTSNQIYVGQRLIIRLPVTATPTLPASPSPSPTRQPSHTPRPPTATRAPTISPTPSPSPTSTRAPLLPISNLPDTKTIAYILIGVGVVGLFAILITGFRK
jgi:LysM repeat protein